MNDKELILEIFKRLNSDFFYSGPQSEAVTESEAAADALGETLYNIGLEDLYDREDALDDEGHWIARFTLKPE